ncbi:SynChlorMet cassette radical SAM/SPASM protein ScmE [bacterium]|nr:SynChlorMet cassette radical SAM/SPASM protein ScmE [candidate division CSSED10-310 bacterium]
MTDNSFYWTRNADISSSRQGEYFRLYNPDTGREKAINESGYAVWNAMNGQTRLEDIVAVLAGIYETDVSRDQLMADINEFSEELLAEGFICRDLFPSSMPLVPEISPWNHESPMMFDLSLTGRCNLKCAYCFYADEMVGRTDLPLESWLQFFRELKALAVRHVTLSGGEVFIRSDLWQLIDAIIEARMRYSILSNGTLITEKTLEQVVSGKRPYRMDSIQISIDGSCSEIHDKSRGRGSFSKALRSLKMLKEAGLPVVVRVTVNRHNVDDLENTARLLIEEIGLSGFGTNDAMPMGAGCAHQGSITLTPDQRIKAMRTLVMLEKRYPGGISALAGSLAEWHMFRDMEKAKASGHKSERWRMGTLSSCGCMFQKLAVHHDGMIAPCNMLADASLGYINETLIKDVWQNHPLLKEMRNRATIPMSDVSGCRDCEWIPYCNGGCPGVEYTRTGQMNRANPDSCYRMFIEQTGGLPDISGEE